MHTNFQLENLKENGPLERCTHRRDKRKYSASAGKIQYMHDNSPVRALLNKTPDVHSIK